MTVCVGVVMVFEVFVGVRWWRLCMGGESKQGGNGEQATQMVAEHNH